MNYPYVRVIHELPLQLAKTLLSIFAMYNESHIHKPLRRLPYFDYSNNGAYFLTLCTENRIHYFGEITNDQMRLSPAGKILEEVWFSLADRFPNVKLDSFVVMPNHIHAVIMIDSPIVGAIHELSLQDYTKYRRRMIIPKIIGFFKMNSARKINILLGKKGPIWQNNYYEHIVRTTNALEKIREYISNNPLRWALDRENLQKIRDDEFDIWLNGGGNS